jgi:ABC-type nitrate/sulfonate/bicarbonate transport system permease component
VTRRTPLRLLLPLFLPALLLAVWWYTTRSGDLFYYPPLADIVDRFVANWFDERVVSDLLPSLRRLLLGWGAASVIGTAVGIALGVVDPLRRLVNPLVNFLRSIPSAALVPFSLVAFGIGDGGKLFLITFVCTWPILLNAMDGAAEVSATQRDTAAAFRIPAWRRILHIVVPSAGPRIASGMSTALSLAVIVMLISEMVASTNGVGYFTIQAQRTFQVPDMWSGIVMLGVLGFLLNLAFRALERRVLAWHVESRKVA